MDGLTDRSPIFISLAQRIDKIYTYTIGPKIFFEVEWIHMQASDTADGYRLCLLQCDSQKRTTCHIGKPTFLYQKLGQGQQGRICLYLVNKNQCVITGSHAIARYGAESKVKFGFCSHLCKQTVTEFVFLHVDLDIMSKQLLADISHDE